MAEPTQFDHDQLGHLLADHLLMVPRFQRSYSWDRGNVEEYLRDLATARKKGVSYFMGTVVFANSSGESSRRQIVDGQQRLATTAILFIAIRDMLRAYGKQQQSDKMDERYLRGYVLSAEQVVERLILSPKDQQSYDALLEGRAADLNSDDRLRACYDTCVDHLKSIAPTARQYGGLMDLSQQLESRVQVLVAVASDLPEAYVIFETLNDRGADLTTADLLKNYLFSQAKDHFHYVETRWIGLETNFEKSEDLVQFIRYEFVSRNGAISTRRLYRAIQEELTGAASAKKYIERLSQAQTMYLAIKDPDHQFWADLNFDVRDALLAFRRFGFESSIPLLLAAFENWKKIPAAKLLIKVAKWSIRAQFVGRIGARLSEEAFGDAAKAISSGEATNQTKVRSHLSRLIPTDAEFKTAFNSYGAVSVARGKYLLAMLEHAHDAANNLPERALEWYSTAVTVEHIMAKSASSQSDAAEAAINQIGNLALLEKKLNHALGSKSFGQKRSTYKDSQFVLTRNVSDQGNWGVSEIEDRTKALAELACRAWPAQ